MAGRDHPRRRPEAGERILDLGAGTASSSASLARSGAQVVAADFSPGMLAEGQRRHGAMRNLSFVQADATALPFADDEFDAVTMSYALRNVNDPKKALRELYRVTKPGGRLVINEFSTPPGKLFRGPTGSTTRRCSRAWPASPARTATPTTI